MKTVFLVALFIAAASAAIRVTEYDTTPETCDDVSTISYEIVLEDWPDTWTSACPADDECVDGVSNYWTYDCDADEETIIEEYKSMPIYSDAECEDEIGTFYWPVEDKDCDCCEYPDTSYYYTNVECGELTYTYDYCSDDECTTGCTTYTAGYCTYDYFDYATMPFYYWNDPCSAGTIAAFGTFVAALIAFLF